MSSSSLSATPLSQTAPPATAPVRLPFLLALASTMMLGPFSLDTYLPAFPAMAASLGTSTQQIALTVSVYIFSLAVGQLIGGVLSDRYGRKPILLSGLGIFAAASLLLSTLKTLDLFLVGRAIQAIGAGWALVSVPAMVRDRVQGLEAAKLFSLMGLIMVLAPGIAPSVGSAILQLGPWNLIFVGLSIYGVLLIPMLMAVVFPRPRNADAAPTPYQSSLPTTERTSVLRMYLDVLRTRAALPFIFWQAASFSTLMVFVTNASFVYQEHFGQSAQTFSILFAVNIATLFCMNLLNRAMLTRIGSMNMLRIATAMQTTGVLLVVAASVFNWPLAMFVPAMAMAVGSNGAISPNIQANFMEHFTRNSGTAAALLGATQFSIAGIITAISSQLPYTLPVIALTMMCCSLVSFALMVRSLRIPASTRPEGA